MGKKVRIPLPSHLATRDATLGEDGILTNLYEESTPIGEMIIKRPGMTDNLAIGPCAAQGSTFFNNDTFFICDNIVHVTPPTVTSATCPTGGIIFGTGAFATLDPITGFVWTTNDDSHGSTGVTVYNPATQTLVHTITYAQLGVTHLFVAGIYYLTASRQMVVATGTADGVNRTAIAINPATYAITSFLIGTNTTAQPSFPIHVPLKNTMNVYSNSTLNGNVVTFNDLAFNGQAAYGTTPNPPTPMLDFAYAPDLPTWATCNGNIFTVVFNNVNSNTTITNSVFTCSAMTYDTRRKRFYVVDFGNSKLSYVAVGGVTVGNFTDVATYTYTKACRMVYDPYRDAIWIVFNNENNNRILLVNPDTGAILKDCFFANGQIPSNNTGGRLLVLDAHHLLNNSNGFLEYLTV